MILRNIIKINTKDGNKKQSLVMLMMLNKSRKYLNHLNTENHSIREKKKLLIITYI